MSYLAMGGFPSQQLPRSKKTKKWRQSCVDYGDMHSGLHHEGAMKSIKSMQINYDLLDGKIHMSDLKAIINPYSIDASFIPDNIQHYSIINSKLRVLEGEETRRLFEYRAVITNPNAISEMEEEKNKASNEMLQRLLLNTSLSQREFQEALQKHADYFQYEYQDKREIRANLLLNHYIKELNIPQAFNKGFIDAEAVGIEAYNVDIVGGEPFVEKINPKKMKVLMNGSSTELEDADMIILEDYWSLGRIVDTYGDQLSKKDIDELSINTDGNNSLYADDMDNIDPRYGFVPLEGDWVAGDSFISWNDTNEGLNGSKLPYDLNGNIRVLRVYWKSRKKIKKVKKYDEQTGEEQFEFYTEDYILNKDKGEEEEIFWVNEAWEGIKIGDNKYVNMRPRPIQYNRLSNPSRCHFGIIGSIYSRGGEEPYSLVDIMKPYAYYYDIVHDRLNKVLARNVGKVLRLDLAKIPDGWTVDKWLYYLNVNGIAVENSFNEGDKGRATGVLAGSMNNATSGSIDASQANEIVQYTNLLEWISSKIGDLAGISRQREGQVSNRETVGGVERATLQSSHSTEWLFFTHDSVKKRVLECLLETAKIAAKGGKIKFENILSDGSSQLIEIDGDEFAECDYGIVVENSQGAQELNQKLDMLAQAGLQNQSIDFSTMMDLYSTKSLAEKQRIVEIAEKRMRERIEREKQQEYEMRERELQQNMEIEKARQEFEYKKFKEEMETKILIAKIGSVAEENRMVILNHDNDEANTLEREKLSEQARQFNERLSFDEKKLKADTEVKKEQIKKQVSKVVSKK